MFIGDRENDIYEFLDRILNQNTIEKSQIESGNNLMQLAILA